MNIDGARRRHIQDPPRNDKSKGHHHKEIGLKSLKFAYPFTLERFYFDDRESKVLSRPLYFVVFKGIAPAFWFGKLCYDTAD